MFDAFNSAPDAAQPKQAEKQNEGFNSDKFFSNLNASASGFLEGIPLIGPALNEGANYVEAALRPADWVMAAIVGAAGLAPTWAAIQRGAIVALANKEALVCAGALVNSRIDRLVYGAADPKAGYCASLGNLVQDPRLNHRLEVTAGVLEEESAALLRGFFATLRRKPVL